MEHVVVSWLLAYGAPVLFALLALGVVGLPLPDETLLSLTGVLIGQGRLHALTAYAAAIGGAATGITLSYALGRFAGLPLLLRYGARLHVDPAAIDRVRVWYSRGGEWLLAGGYFIPGVRHVTAIIAGASKLSIGRFMAFAYVGAALWASCFVTLGYVLGEHWHRIFAGFHRHIMIAAVLLAVSAAGYAYLRMRQS